jgi:hypothetical protein
VEETLTAVVGLGEGVVFAGTVGLLRLAGGGGSLPYCDLGATAAAAAVDAWRFECPSQLFALSFACITLCDWSCHV